MESLDVVNSPFRCPYGCDKMIPVSVAVLKGEETTDEQAPNLFMPALPKIEKEVYMTEEGPSFRIACPRCNKELLIVCRILKGLTGSS